MTAAFGLLQNVNLATELGVRMDGAGFAQYLTTLNFSSLDTTQQGADVVAGLGVVQQNISTPVTTVLRVSWIPTISTSSPTLT